MTVARPAGLAVPRLAGVANVMGSGAGRATRAQVALAMLDAGVASPALWKRSYRSPDRFLRESLQAWVDAHVGAEVREWFPMRIRLDFDLDPWSSATMLGRSVDRRAPVAGDPLVLVLESEAAGFFPFSKVFAWLEREDPQLPATVYQRFSELKRVVYVYDWWEAREFEAMLQDGMDEEDLAAVRAEHPDIAPPDCLDCRPLTDAQVQRRRRDWSPTMCRVIDAAGELAARAKATTWGTKRERERRWSLLTDGDYEHTPPALVVAGEESDRVCAAFDEQMMGGGGCPAEPARFWVIEHPTLRDVRRAFEQLGRVLDTLAAAARFFQAVPEQGKVAPDSLAAVLEPQPVRVRVA